jgi:hypothetical protein
MRLQLRSPVIIERRGNAPLFQPMEVAMRKISDIENLPCFQHLA